MSENLGKQPLRSATTNVLGTVWNLMVGLLLAPFVVHSLGDFQNGYWVIARSVFGYYGFLDFGISLSVARFLSVAIGKKDNLTIRRTVQTGFFCVLCIDLVIFILCLIAAAVVGNFSFASDMALVRDLLLIVAFSILVILPGRIFAGILTAHIRQDQITMIGTANTTIRAIFIVIVLKMGFGVRSVAIVSAMIALLTAVMYFFAARRLITGFSLFKPAFHRETFSPLFHYGIFISLASLGDIVRWGAVPVVAGILNGASFVTFISIPINIGRYGVGIISGLFSVLMPVFGQQVGKGDNQSIHNIFYRSLNFSIIFAVAVFAGSIILGKNFIGNWMGPQYTSSYPALVLISIGLMAATIQNPIINLIQGMGWAKIFSLTNGLEAALNILLCILLGKYGMVGYGMAFAVPLLIIKLVVQPLVFIPKLGWQIREFYRFLIWRLGKALILTFGIGWLILHINDGETWGKFIILGLAYVGSLSLTAWFLLIPKTERTYLTRWAMNLVGRKH